MNKLRSAAAALLLLILVMGVPLLLAGTIGNPLKSWPDLLAGDVTDRVIIDILAAAAYLAWAQFTLAAAVEVVSAVRRTPMPRPIPGVFGGQQHLARTLVTAALLLLPTVGATVAPTAHAVAALLPHPQTIPAATPLTRPAATDPADPAAAWPAYTVTPDGPATFWDLAETTLGSGDRWRDLWHANQGRVQPDGTVLDSAAALRPGWTVLVPKLPNAPAAPADTATLAGRVVTVQPGDTLSELAAAHGAEDWREIWPANQGRPQPGGRALTDPDQIEPGWTILIPAGDTAPAVGDAVTVRAGNTLSGIAADHDVPLADLVAANTGRAQPDGQALADPDVIEPGWIIRIPTQADQPAAEQPAPAPAPSPVQAPAPPAAAGGSAGGEIILTAPPTQPEPPASTGSTGQAPPADRAAGEPTLGQRDTPVPTETGDETSGAAWPAWAVITTGGTLLAGSALTVLRRHRRSQMRRRPPGRFIGTAPDDVIDTERVLLAAGGDGWDRTRWMDRALRSLATARGAHTLPDVLAVRVGDTTMDLLLRTPAPDPTAPWTADPDGRCWHLHRADPLPFDDDTDRPYHYAPYPALATVGQADDGDTWLLDLEAAKYLPVTGPRAVATDFARFLATELATNIWSEILSVTLSGLGPELGDLDPQRLRVDTDLTAAVTRLTHQISDITNQPPTGGVLDARLDGTDGDPWAPEVLIVAGSAADSDAVSRTVDRLLAAGDRAACAVVACRDTPDPRGGLAATIDTAGRLQIPALGLDLRAARASAADSADLAALLDHARTAADRAMPRPPEGHPLHGSTDDAGLITDLLPASRTDTDPDRVDIRTLLPEPVDTYLDDAAATAADVHALAPHIPDDTAARLTDTVTGLDRDLADWHNPASPRPKVTVLGPVEVTAPGALPDGHPRTAWNTEMIAYLATRENGATVEDLAAAMWPGEPDVTGKSKLRNAVYIARKWLGPNPATGRDHLPSQKGTAGAAYRLEDVLLDADLFVRLRVRGQAKGGRDGITDLRAALDLVTGPPFDRRRPGGYSWLAGTALDYQYQAMIADVAHTVATHHLAAGEPAQAEWAARVALHAGSQEDTPLLDLIAACHQQGDTAAADQHVRAVMTNHDAEIEEDLPTRTYEILLSKGWLPAPTAPRQPTS